MNKEEYLKKLAKGMKKFPKEEREDIISDYEEHFRIGVENGREEDEISEALGHPETVVKQIKADYMIKKAEKEPSAGSMIEAVLAVAGLGIFNLIFVAVPALVVAAIIVTLFVIGFGLILFGIFMVLSSIIQPIFPQYINLSTSMKTWGPLAIGLGGFGSALFGTLLVAYMVNITKWFYKLVIKYLKLNFRIIKEKTEVFK